MVLTFPCSHAIFSSNSPKQSSGNPRPLIVSTQGASYSAHPCTTQKQNKKKRCLTVVAAVGDVSPDSTTYLLAGAATIALLGTAFPVLFARKDTCPECDGAGFVRKTGATLRANAARKDETQIVCPTCNGLGKLNQIDKYK